MKKYSKILVLILSLALICTGLILAVSAEDETPTFNLVSAIQNAADGDTIVMTGNASITDADATWGVTINKNLTIDLNGYTLTIDNAKRGFNLQHAGKVFTITGEGTINVLNGPLMVNGDAKYTGIISNVIGTGKGITINHTGAGNLFATQTGIATFKNLTINTTTKDHIFKNASGAESPEMHFDAVKINATTACSGNATVFYGYKNGRFSLNYCTVETKGQSLFGIKNHTADTPKIEDYIVVDNSYIHLSYGSGSGPELVYSGDDGYGDLSSDIVIKNSYVSWNTSTLAKNNHNGSALVFKNSEILFNGKQGNIFRSMNVRLEDGSIIRGNHTYYANDTVLYAMNDNSGAIALGDYSKVQMIINVGTRFDEATYKKLINRTGVKKDDATATVTYFAEGSIVYPDGTSPTNSTTYKMVYDPMGNPDAPYVVVTADQAATITDNLYVSANPSATVAYNGVSGTTGNYRVGMNYFFRFTSNGKSNSNAPCYGWGLKEGIKASDYNVFVFEFDIATDSNVGLTETYVTIHARGNAKGDGNSAIDGSMLLLKKDGSVFKGVSVYKEDGTYLKDEYVDTGVKLDLNTWNRVTIVVDTTNTLGTAYTYVNGTFINAHDAYKAGAYLFAPRLNFTGAGTVDTGSSVMIDNAVVRAAIPLTDGKAPTALTDNGASYLLNGGKAWNEGAPTSNAITVGGVNLPIDINKALDLANNNGYIVQLNKNILSPVKANAQGTIFSNGHSINLSEGSMGSIIIGDNEFYEFDEKYSSIVAKYQFYLSNNTDAASLADPKNWTEVGETGISTILASLYDYNTLGTFGKYTENGYLTSKAIGWTDTLGSTELRNTPATLEEALSGEVIKLYPVFGEYKKDYDIVFLNKDGNFDRGYKGTTWYGSGLRTMAMKYGETLVLNANITSQVSIDQVFGNSSNPSNSACSKTNDGATADKYIGIDFNGFTWKIDPNYSQNKAVNKTTALNIFTGENVNVYSSYPGGRLEGYGVVLSSTTNNYASSGGVLFGFNGNIGYDTPAGNSNGEVTQNNTKLNVGTVTVNGKVISGSNLSLASAVLLDANNGDSTCQINIDGVKAERNSTDYPAYIITRNYFGKINVTNTTIVNGVGGSIVHGHEMGYIAATEEAPMQRALADILFDNCVILVKDNDLDIINKDWSINTLTFRNCVTNGKLVADSMNALILGEGNIAASMYGKTEAGVIIANWNNSFNIGTELITGAYFLVKDQDFSGTGDEYTYHEYVFASYGYNGEGADSVLGTVGVATVKEADAVTVTYNNTANGETATYKYAAGGNVVLTPEDYTGAVINVAHKGTWTVNEIAGSALPTNIQADVTVSPEYTVAANIAGLKANLSLYSDFVINLYIPADYAQYVTAVNGAALAGETVTIGEKQYYKVTASKVAKEASDAAVFEITLAEGNYTATKTVNVSITDYASTILAGEFTDADKILMYNMLSFVGAASKYFEGTEDTVIAGLLETYAAWNKVSVDKSYANALEDTGLGDAFASAGIVLGDAPAFTLVPNGKFAGTVNVTYGDGNVRIYTVNAGSTEAIKIEGMKIFNFGVNINITAVGTIEGVDGEQTVAGTLNLDTYAKYQTANAEEGVVAVVEALYNYVKVAEQYKAGTLVLPEEAPAE